MGAGRALRRRAQAGGAHVLDAPYPLGGGRGAGGELTSAAQTGAAGYLLLSW